VADVLTATVDNPFAQVLLKVEFTAAGSLTALVERSDNGGVTWAAVRGGNLLTLVGPAPGAGDRYGYLYDTEMPLDTAVRYRATSNLGTVITAGPVTVVSSGLAWMKDPARPWANLRIDDCSTTTVPRSCATPLTEPALTLVADGLGAQEYDGDFTLSPVLNRARPTDVFAYRKDSVTAWTIVSKTLPSKDSVNTFYAWGGPIFLQFPPVYGWPDRYYQPGKVTEGRLSKDMRVPYRVWPVPITVVDMQPGAAQGTFHNNWCIVDSTYPTWANLTATGFTWATVVSGGAA
jgi:hypothetical protein